MTNPTQKQHFSLFDWFQFCKNMFHIWGNRYFRYAVKQLFLIHLCFMGFKIILKNPKKIFYGNLHIPEHKIPFPQVAQVFHSPMPPVYAGFPFWNMIALPVICNIPWYPFIQTEHHLDILPAVNALHIHVRIIIQLIWMRQISYKNKPWNPIF